MHRKRIAGFSLLEAIVALAILAAAGLALFAAMSQSLQMAARAERAREVDAALRNALAWMERVNPMETPQGEQPLGAFVLRWQAEPVEPPRDGASGYLHPGLYKVGLYRVTLQLWRAGRLEREATLRRAGYRQVRQPPRV
ncbi:prepilin-type N-terminal cleavage/methylation domain-containing protein [Vulcaniibacterium gelatinicum]|uniref:prepilin-type N-terminal cleavage/methylation domain-containing protein n=1 Tax=Vulcaniibacterium gelatinicum TaxID=2598725 RepID=UPI0011CBD44A|nr:prepilin-type N-terminal cleavage/methylation domain-containing protein [Vulcaniibacterium gelatinicum]